MFKIYGGANKFKQWTQDNKLIMDELPIGADVMFYNDPNEDDPLITEVYEIRDEEDNVFRVCDVPNILLTETEKIKVRIPKVVKGLYGNLYKAAGRNEMIFEVEPAEKPSDYVYEKTVTNTIDPSRLPEGYPYETTSIVTLVDNATVNITDSFSYESDSIPCDWDFVVGESYNLTVDKETYTNLVAEQCSGYKCLWVLEGTLQIKQYSGYWTFTAPLRGSYRISISGPCSVVKQIDSKFLPTSVPMIDSAVVGQVPKVAAVDENGVPTKWEAGEAGSQQIQSDWNQNDENAPDHVKNRLCYKYTELIDAVSETTLDATTASEGYYTATIQGGNYSFGNTESASVVYDGTTYENVPASHDESWVGGAPQSVDTIGSIPEYPFKIVMKNGSYENNLTLYAETQGEHTFCIKKPVNKVKTLDNEYIPKNVASLPGAYHGYTDGYPILYVSGFEEDDNGFKRASDFSALSMSSIEGWTFTLEDGTTVIKRVGIFR